MNEAVARAQIPGNEELDRSSVIIVGFKKKN